MERYAEVMSHHERDEHRARRLCVLRDVQRHGDGNRGNPLTLYCALNQRYRLVSYGSRGCEQHEVRTVLNHCIRNFLRKGALQALRVHVVADE